jgi:dephospho-CoA kinase
MGATDSKTKSVDVAVENVGGIDATDVSFSAGVTILTGRNATNRTSLLQAIMAGLGSDNVSLKGDADEGRVELTVGEETYTRTLTRQNGTVVTDGDPYLDEAEIADLFVFLLESNEARRAVERTENLRELIMRPVDTAAIESEIDQLQGERDEIEERLDDADTVVVDGIRSDVEVERFVEAFDEDFTLVKIHAPDELRAERLDLRGRDASAEEGGESLAERDGRELGFGMGAAMERADVTIVNDASLDAFRADIERLLADGPGALAGDTAEADTDE